jgi:hypothetical protein
MRIASFLIYMMMFQAASLFAQGSPLACDGDFAIVRVSQIAPGGSMKGFMDAAAAHQAWYRANGVTDNEIVSSRVIVRDETTGEMKYSETEIVTYHIRPPGPGRDLPRNDPAWNAYVEMYRRNSEIKFEYLTCVPKLGH